MHTNNHQGASSLFMYNGTNDTYQRGMPLRIKDGAGLDVFTEWQSISDSLEQNDVASFEDDQPNSLSFTQVNISKEFTPVNLDKNGGSPGDLVISDYVSSSAVVGSINVEKLSFNDTWKANKIKVYDNLAFVCYEDYTDLEKHEIDFTDPLGLKQYYLSRNTEITYGEDINEEQWIGTLSFGVFGEPSAINYFNHYSDFVNTRHSNGFGGTPFFNFPLVDFYNCILKVEFGDNAYNYSNQTLYFHYGGALPDSLSELEGIQRFGLNDAHLAWNPENPSQISERDLDTAPDYKGSIFDNPTNVNSKNLGNFAPGYSSKRWFYIVPINSFAGPVSDFSSYYGFLNRSAYASNFNIQLDLQLKVDIEDTSQLRLVKTGTDDNESQYSIYSKNIDATITLIKFDPIRKCGKVDVYTKKTGFVSAISGNTITSNNHNLKTGDVVEFSSVLFDIGHTGASDAHPMNGLKYVKVLTDNTFEIYDEEYFLNPSSTNNIRTLDGIKWIYHSNKLGEDHSWEYYKTLFSPTGKNGYKFNHINFIDNKRFTPVDFSNLNSTNNGINLDFTDPDIVASSLDENIPAQPKAVLDNSIRGGFYRYYPYHCQDRQDVTESDKNSYWGSKFGCDLDVDFSHMSGDSKVYTLAIGERGSDVSVDVLGVTGTEDAANRIYDHFGTEGFTGTRRVISDTLTEMAPSRLVPDSLPHGKTHLLTVTVDSTGSISDISWKNTLYGGGGAERQSWQFPSYSERNPWGSISLLDEYAKYEDSLPTLNTFAFADKENGDIIEDQYNSNYWIRSAVVHWYPNSIHDYKVKTNQERDTKYLRAIDSVRHPRPILSVDSDSSNNRSRFGSVGFGGDDFTPFERINRYGKSDGIEPDLSGEKALLNYSYNVETDARWIYPWVDSFGKSVVIKNMKGLTGIIGYSDDDIKSVVLSASTTRSNIEYNNTNNLELITSSKINESDTVSEIGQIQANFVYSDGTYHTSMDWMYLNSGGSDCTRLFNSFTTKNSQRGLKTGSLAGYGMKEVLTSCALSASHIQWYKDQIVWVDQELYSNKSTVNVLKFNDGFEKDFTFAVNYIDSRDSAPLTLPTARNTGDGFGIDFKYEDNIFVTNSRSKTTELGYNISDYLSDRDRIDFIQVYEKLKDSFNLTQKISPTVDKTNSKYNNLHNYDLLYIPGCVSYEGDSVNTLTWDIDLSGRYDLSDGKILIKDPLQYSLFGRDFSVSSFEQDDSISEEQAEMYMAINERVRVSNESSLNSLQYEYISADTFEYACRDVGGAKNSSVSTKTPFFFFKLPIENLDVVEDVEITFDMIAEDIYSYFDIKGQTNLADETNNIIPRIVLYAKDPRSMIIENGPADSGTNLTSFPKYENGIWKEFADIDSEGEHFSYEFPGWYRGGAQDLFFYGSVPGEDIETRSVRINQQTIEPFLFGGEKNLGEYYDLTVGTRLGGNAGDPAWIAPDYYFWTSSSYASRVRPYAKLFMPTASQDGYSVRISRSELKDFIITNNLIKDEDRPTSVVSGFNDSVNKYNVENIEYSIIVGLVLTNLESFDISQGVSTHEEPSSSFNIGPLRHISDNQSSQDYVNARYPYSNVVGFYSPSSEGNKYNGSYLEYELRTTVKSLNVVLSKRQGSNQRYDNKFHKIANIDYENKYVGANPDAFVSDQNPIISIGKKSSGFDLNENYEVLNSENISNSSTKSALLGGLNLNKDQYLSLNVKAVSSEDIYSDLFVDGVGYVSGNPVLFTKGVAGKNNNFNLHIRNGERTDNAKLNMFLRYQVKDRPISLFTYEVVPSSNMPLYIPTQDSVSDMTLTMNNPSKKNTTLNIKAPIGFNSSIPLVRVPQVSGSFSAFINGIGKINNNLSLFTEAVAWEPADMTLAFSPGASGNIPLFLARNLEQNKDMTLVMPEVYGVSSGVAPLWIARNGKEDDTSLFIKPPFPYNEDTELFINSQIENNSDTTLTTVSQIVFGDSTLSDKTYTSLFMPNDFPSGEMPLYQSPIGYHNSGVSLMIGIPFKDNETFLRVGQGSEIGSSLFIDGHALLYNKNSTMFLEAQNITSSVNLFVEPVTGQTIQTDLNIAGSLQAGNSASIPLFAGKEIYAQDDTSLYINNDNTAVSVGSTGQINELTVAISGGLSAPLKQDGPLFIQVPPFVSGVQQAPLYLSVDEPVYGPGGGILSSGSQEFFIEGNNDAGVWYKNNNNTTLNITSTYPSSGNATLYIDRPLEAGVSLIIPSLNASGDMNVYISGANIGSGIMELYISPPQTNSSDLFTGGYLE